MYTFKTGEWLEVFGWLKNTNGTPYTNIPTNYELKIYNHDGILAPVKDVNYTLEFFDSGLPALGVGVTTTFSPAYLKANLPHNGVHNYIMIHVTAPVESAWLAIEAQGEKLRAEDIHKSNRYVSMRLDALERKIDKALGLTNTYGHNYLSYGSVSLQPPFAVTDDGHLLKLTGTTTNEFVISKLGSDIVTGGAILPNTLPTGAVSRFWYLGAQAIGYNYGGAFQVADLTSPTCGTVGFFTVVNLKDVFGVGERFYILSDSAGVLILHRCNTRSATIESSLSTGLATNAYWFHNNASAFSVDLDRNRFAVISSGGLVEIRRLSDFVLIASVNPGFTVRSVVFSEIGDLYVCGNSDLIKIYTDVTAAAAYTLQTSYPVVNLYQLEVRKGIIVAYSLDDASSFAWVDSGFDYLSDTIAKDTTVAKESTLLALDVSKLAIND